jgi:TetR/AcrR family transcriptional repressor of uid operon
MEPRLVAADLPVSESLLERAFSNAVGGADAEDANAEVLDAAFDLFCRQGIQRTTMEDVARRAGLSRITVYRRVRSKETLVEQVVLREFRRYLDQFLLDIGQAETVEDRVVVGFISSLRAIRSNPLIEGLMAAEPDLLAPSILGEGGHNLAIVGQFLAGQLRREQRAGNVSSAVDVDLVAELMVRVSTSFLLTPSERVDLDDEAQLGEIARQFLVPMLQPAQER